VARVARAELNLVTTPEDAPDRMILDVAVCEECRAVIVAGPANLAQHNLVHRPDQGDLTP
jgi:hypothetical protein